MIYEPREDSFLLQKSVKEYATGKVLDMGTGSGIQGLTAKEKGCDVFAVDINPEAVNTAKEKGLKSIQSDLFEKIPGKFDTIIFNPPYLPPEEKHEDVALYSENNGRATLDRFLDESINHLNEKGQILFLQSSINGEQKTIEKLKKLGLEHEVIGRQKLFFEELIVFRAWKNG